MTRKQLEDVTRSFHVLPVLVRGCSSMSEHVSYPQILTLKFLQQIIHCIKVIPVIMLLTVRTQLSYKKSIKVAPWVGPNCAGVDSTQGASN